MSPERWSQRASSHGVARVSDRPVRRYAQRPLLACAAATLCSAFLGACADRAAGPSLSQPTGCNSARSLQVGQVQLISGGASLECIVLAGTAEVSEYAIITANAASRQDELQSYRVTGEPGAGAATVAISSAANNVSTSQPIDESAALAASARLEAGLRARSRLPLAGHDLTRVAAAARLPFLRGNQEGPVPAHSGSRAAMAVGDTVSYRVGDARTTTMCTTFSNVRAVVRAVGTRAMVVQDVTAPMSGFTAADFAAIASEYDAIVHPTEVQWFGEPTDINGDRRVTLLFTPAVNRLTPTGSLGFVGGYFWAADLLPRSVPSQNYTCPASNEQEIMYLLTPDPDGQVNGNRFTVTTVRRAMRGTVAHELQHLINQGVRQGLGAPPEVDWLNEGLSHFAEELVGRAVRGFPSTRRLDYDDVLVDLDDFDSFFRQNLIRLRSWMARPDLASPISSKALSELAPRGASWALLRYSLDQYAGASPATFTRALVIGPQVDVANLEARARVPFSEIQPGFLMAALGDTLVTGLLPRFRFTSWAIRDAMSGINGGFFPLRLTALPVETITQSLSGSGNYFLLSRPAGSGPFTFRMRAENGGLVGFPDARVYLLRLR